MKDLIEDILEVHESGVDIRDLAALVQSLNGKPSGEYLKRTYTQDQWDIEVEAILWMVRPS